MQETPSIRFRQSNPSAFILAAGLIFFALLVLYTFFPEKNRHLPGFCLAVAAVISSIAGVAYKHLFIHIVIDETGVRYRSLFRKMKMDWTMICEYGAFYRTRYRIILEEDMTSYTQLVGQRKVFVSAFPGFRPGLHTPAISTTFMTFDYREKAMEVIRYYMARPKSDWMNEYAPYQGF